MTEATSNASQAQTEQKPIGVTAVAVTRESDDGELYLDWLLEGGIEALEFAGQVLVVADTPITDEEGSGAVYASPVTRTAPPAAAVVMLDQYDAGLLSDFGGGNVDWWQDYIRAELGRAHDFYQSQLLAPVEQSATPEGWLFRINPHNPNSSWSFTQDATAAEGYRRAENVQIIRIGGGAAEQGAMVVLPQALSKSDAIAECGEYGGAMARGYAAYERQLKRLNPGLAFATPTPEPLALEHVGHQYQGRDGLWCAFADQRHYENTVADGSWPIRAIYAPAAPEPACAHRFMYFGDQQARRCADCMAVEQPAKEVQ